jgi:hypothetical protein
MEPERPPQQQGQSVGAAEPELARRPSAEELRATWRAAFNDPLDLSKWRTALQLPPSPGEAPTSGAAASDSSSSSSNGGSSTSLLSKSSSSSSSGASWEVDWAALSSDPEKRVQAALWSMRPGTSGHQQFAELCRKLHATSKHAEELLGRQAKVTLLEMYQPVMFLLQAWDSFVQSSPRAVRAVAERDGAIEASRESLLELDRWFHFADWAYDESESPGGLTEDLARRGFSLVYHDKEVSHEKAASYLAFNSQEKVCVLAIKGTSSMADVGTDLLCKAMPFMGTKFAHEGIMNAARRVVARCVDFIKSLFAPQGYEVVVTGHSLGAGTGALAAMILKEELHVPLVRGVLYACPPVLDQASAIAARFYITSMVHDRDVITRTSLSNMNIQHAIIAEVSRLMKEGSLTKDKVEASLQAHHEAQQSLQQPLQQPPPPPQQQQQQQQQAPPLDVMGMVRSIQDEFKLHYEQDLYVPGLVVYIFRDAVGKYDVMQADGQLSGLRQMLPTKTMVSDHSMTGYRRALSEVMLSHQQVTSVSSPILLPDSIGSHFSIERWKSFKSPEPLRPAVTFYEVSLAVTRSDDSAAAAAAAAAVAAAGAAPELASHASGSAPENLETKVVSRFFSWRRFNDFAALDESVRAAGLSAPNAPPLPSKFTQTGPEQRAALLVAYLERLAQGVLRHSDQRVLALVLDFAGAGSAPPAPQFVLDALRAEADGRPQRRGTHTVVTEAAKSAAAAAGAAATAAATGLVQDYAAGYSAGSAPVAPSASAATSAATTVTTKSWW